jgi:hypothetical protein
MGLTLSQIFQEIQQQQFLRENQILCMSILIKLVLRFWLVGIRYLLTIAINNLINFKSLNNNKINNHLNNKLHRHLLFQPIRIILPLNKIRSIYNKSRNLLFSKKEIPLKILLKL